MRSFLYFAVETGALVWVGILYFVVTLVFAILLNRFDSVVLGPARDNIVTDLLCMIAMIQITVALVRRLVRQVPYPLDGAIGYDHSKLTDINGGVVISYTVFALQTSMSWKLKHLMDRLFGGPPKEGSNDPGPPL